MKRLTRAEKQAETRAALLDAAARVFVERGFAGSSVEAVAAEAGFTRGAFYSNFASKEQLFVELLHERVYARYRAMTESRLADVRRQPTLRESGEELAAIQGDPDNAWLFRLWLELIAQAGRDPEFRSLAASFWSGNRGLMAELTQRAYASAGKEPPMDPRVVATALIALDIGISLQHFVDPGEVPLDVYGEVWEKLLGPLAP